MSIRLSNVSCQISKTHSAAVAIVVGGVVIEKVAGVEWPILDIGAVVLILGAVVGGGGGGGGGG
jgi:hypothetical protein